MAVPLRDDAPTRRTPWITMGLILVNVVVFLFVQPSAFQNPPSAPASQGLAVTAPVGIHVSADPREIEALRFTYRWGAVPCEVLSGQPLADGPRQCAARPSSALLSPHKSVWLALLTSMFLHGSVRHIVFNMLFLWVFGNNVEDRIGHRVFLAFYLLGGLAAGLGYVLANRHGVVPALGASGAIAAVMGAYLVFRPRGRILIGVMTAALQVVYVPAFVVLGLFFVTQFFTPAAAHVAWQAHVAGMAFGIVAAALMARRFHDPDRAPAYPTTF